jgi:hypothetical protein
MIVKGLGCDCYQQDTDGNCLDPQPCAGDTTQAFDPVTGLAINSLSPSTTPIVTAQGPMVTTTNTTNATTAAVSTPSCTETYISGVCDYFLYIGAAIGGLYLLSMIPSGSHRR